jgi:hypothetical protein
MSEFSILNLIGREKELFSQDVEAHEALLLEVVSYSTFLVIGGAGSIGQAATNEIFKRILKNCTQIAELFGGSIKCIGSYHEIVN